MTRRHNHNQGFSLIEILTTMVILLVGIMSIVRLFPGGFLVNQRSEELTLATRLAKLEMERNKNAAANLPGAIVPVEPIANGASPLGYSFIVSHNIPPDDISDPKTAPFGVNPYYISNANRSGRRIIGETVRIPVPSPIGSGQRGSVYMLANGPYYDAQWLGSVESIFVSGAAMQRSLQEAANPNTPILNSSGTYAIDYDDRTIAFTADPVLPRSFLLTYSYLDNNNQTQTVVDEVINVAAGQSGWITVAVPGGRPMVPESDIVSRKFRQILPNDPWAFEVNPQIQDPYEFKVISPVIGGFANVGVLAFSPAGRDYTERTGGGAEPLTARIDYDVLDWHIIKEDRPLPASPPYDVRLTLKRIKKTGDFETDQAQYKGIVAGGTQPSPDLLVYDIATGQLIPDTDANTQAANYTIDYRDGVVHFSDAFGAAFGSSNLRFFYKATGDWALQIQKACDLYKRHTPAAPGDEANVGLCEYYLGGGPAGGVETRMYFPLTEAGKTVTIREVAVRDANGLRKAGNETFRINANPALFETLGGRTLTWLDLTEKPGYLGTAWAIADPLQPAVGVLGISFRSRVMWNNGGSVQATANGNEHLLRWRKVDVDSFLTRTNN